VTLLKGFDEVRGPDGATAWVAREHHAPVCNALLRGEALTPLNQEGRGEVFVFPLGPGQGVYRGHLRGGLVRHLLRRSYFMENRPRKELQIHHAIWSRGLPVPRPLGAVWRRNGPFYCGAMATEYLEGVSLEFYLRQGLEDSGEVLRGVGETLARFHEAGVYHADLNVNNIMLVEGRAHLIDFDKAVLGTRGDVRRGARNLRRLERSFGKRGLPHDAHHEIARAYAAHLECADRVAPLVDAAP